MSRIEQCNISRFTAQGSSAILAPYSFKAMYRDSPIRRAMAQKLWDAVGIVQPLVGHM